MATKGLSLTVQEAALGLLRDLASRYRRLP